MEKLVDEHSRCLVKGGTRVVEVHSNGATEPFEDRLKVIADSGWCDMQIPFGEFLQAASRLFCFGSAGAVRSGTWWYSWAPIITPR